MGFMVISMLLVWHLRCLWRSRWKFIEFNFACFTWLERLISSCHCHLQSIFKFSSYNRCTQVSICLFLSVAALHRNTQLSITKFGFAVNNIRIHTHPHLSVQLRTFRECFVFLQLSALIGFEVSTTVPGSHVRSKKLVLPQKPFSRHAPFHHHCHPLFTFRV